MFDIAFQGPSPQPSSSAFANSQKNSPSMHAMLGSGTTFEDWFFDTGSTHRLAKDHTSLSNVHPYLGTDQVTIGNGHTLPIAHTGEKQFSYSFDQFLLQQVLHVPQLSSNLINVLNFALIIMSFLSFTLITFLRKIKCPRPFDFRVPLKLVCILSQLQSLHHLHLSWPNPQPLLLKKLSGMPDLITLLHQFCLEHCLLVILPLSFPVINCLNCVFIAHWINLINFLFLCLLHMHLIPLNFCILTCGILYHVQPHLEQDMFF